ncbi:4-(cytidine 5'-diphospho)-2-C-methyl-D-erythritol kinase [Anabaena sp. FACHB-1237]|uniref:4-(cytidine 5'-diphospho)-2-C-methyl-D-erythritol kinase n=1 Tax=Anabaena sp. FACHB-1237 TaxID=2692769 RepID=UPI0016803443|nr:4-(cytidine 5'-diphospho)-2-C-methyl-D-erythritol kinase [Anabaena sp. FACHB-1237]MBD2138595.1 4-(cytidine 5'-diphospho)-2-C-methyl-D-erythritol kinase [Anabaena sp. FACHB-1237]
MRKYKLIAPAKINLYLEIIGSRADGFHELAMILQSINLADEIEIHAASTENIRIYCQHPQVPNDKTNLVYRAAELMTKEFPDAFNNFGGVDITLIKNIPVAAGLAGGSTNAAAILVGIDLLWNLGLTESELQQLGGKLGSDVPFCIAGGTAIATGRGEKLSPLPTVDNLHIVLGKYRSLEVSTPWAYKSYREKFGHTYIADQDSLAARSHAFHSEAMVKAIYNHNIGEIAHQLHNDLEKVVLPAYPQVLRLRELFAAQPQVLNTMMSGSGPSVFAIVESASQAEIVKQKIRSAIPDPDLELFTTHTIEHGIEISS